MISIILSIPWDRVVGEGFSILFCVAIMLNPPVYVKHPESHPTQPISRNVDIVTMGERRESILLHLPRK
jgi:hypothetical protein